MKKEAEEEIEYTQYEKARILGARALQISANAPILLKISKEELIEINYDPIKIAEMEFDSKVLPITVRRPLPRRIAKELIEEKEIDIAEEAEEEPKKEAVAVAEKEKGKEKGKAAEKPKEAEPEAEEAEEEVSEELEKATEEGE